jgi:hypothetical protein
MPGEREPKQVPVNPLEAFDNREPTNEEIERALRVLAVARRALQAEGIAVRWEATLQAPGAGEDQDDELNFDSISVDDAAHLITKGRNEELMRLALELRELAGNIMLTDKERLAHLIAYVALRDDEIKRMTSREPE